MTIDEAMAAVPRSEACWIVWNAETGEILAVNESRPGALDLDLQGLSEFRVPTRARELEARKVTRRLLERERDDTLRIKTREQVLTAWAHAPVEALLRILERGEYPPAMKLDYDSHVIVDHLWELHRDELDAGIQARLQALVGGPLLGEAASRELEICLLALAGDHAALGAIWRGERPGQTCFADTFLLMDCFAYLRSTDLQLIGDLITIVKQAVMFTIRREAMSTLGKLGPVSGARAARVIREAIHDSSPEIVAERERVLQRIESADEDWVRCRACCYGRVHRTESHGTAACPVCLGLGYVIR